MNILFAVLCVALAYSAFCRAVHLDKGAMLRIRWAVTGVGSTAFYGLYLAFTGWQPDAVHIILVLVFWLYMTAFAKTWPPQGMPPRMRRDAQGRQIMPDHVL